MQSESSTAPKRCSMCREWLEAAAFHKNKRQPGGLSYQCQPCYNRYRASRTEQNKAYKQRYFQEHKEASRERGRRWRLANPEKVAEMRRAYQMRHPNRVRWHNNEARRKYREGRSAYAKRYAAANRERLAEKLRQWRRDNPEKRALQNKRTRLTTSRVPGVQIPGRCTLEQLEARFAFYGWCCYLCGHALTARTLTADHRIPINRGGSNWPANLAPCCRRCNSRKQDRTEGEYRAGLIRRRGPRH